MSYDRVNNEKLTVKNDNMRTIAFTESVKKYLWDFLGGNSIETLHTFNLLLDADGLRVEIQAEKEFNGPINVSFRSSQLHPSEISELLNNLERYENIQMKLEYAGSFNYFYPYGIERFSLLLNEYLKDSVTYRCREYRNYDTEIFVFENRPNGLVHGVIVSDDYSKLSNIDNWEPHIFTLHIFVYESISFHDYNHLVSLGSAFCAKYDSRLFLETCSDPNENEMVEVDIFDIEYDFGQSRKFNIDDILAINGALEKVIDFAAQFKHEIKPCIVFEPADSTIECTQLRIKYNSDQGLQIEAYSADFEEVEEYEGSDDVMLEIAESLGGATIPISIDTKEWDFGEENVNE